MSKKGLFALILVLLICSFTLPAFGLDGNITVESLKSNEVRPLWTEIAEFTNSFDISTGGKATVESILYTYNVSDIGLKAELQQLKNGSWTTIKSWTGKSKDIYCTIGEAWYIVSGYSYRLVATGTVYKNGALAEQTTYTSKAYVF